MTMTPDEQEEYASLIQEAEDRGTEKLHTELLIYHARALGIGDAIGTLEELFNQGN